MNTSTKAANSKQTCEDSGNQNCLKIANFVLTSSWQILDFSMQLDKLTELFWLSTFTARFYSREFCLLIFVETMKHAEMSLASLIRVAFAMSIID
jgi:hypothetical protein